MTKMVISEEIKEALKRFLSYNPTAELVNTYLHFIELKFDLHPVVFPKEKTIYQGVDNVISHLEKEGKLWNETEIKIGIGNQSIDDQTKKIYICPFTGKVFGDNTHPNPQDAIYDWVSKCPENKERVGGLPAKRFYISEDPAVIANYAAKVKRKEPITKVVFSSLINGKLFGSKQAVIEDFKSNYVKPVSLVEVQNQNRFQIEEEFLAFIQKQLAEDKVGAFIEALAEDEEFTPYITAWIE